MTTVQLVLFSGLGALSQEMLHLSTLRHSLQEQSVRDRLKDPLYWTIGGLMVLLSMIVAYFWFEGPAMPARKLDVFLFGAAAPALLKQAVGALAGGQKSEEASRGPILGPSSSFRTYFRLG